MSGPQACGPSIWPRGASDFKPPRWLRTALLPCNIREPPVERVRPPSDNPVPVPCHDTAGEGAVFHLAQSWRPHTEPLFRPGLVRLAWQPAFLLVVADLVDEEVLTGATADNQRMWELGDVFEMFVKAEGRDDYVELHATPNGRRLHLRFPGARAADPAAFHAEASIAPDGWRVTARIPAGVAGLDCYRAGLALRASFCRYDAGTGTPPVLSSTSPHPVPSFHRPDEWPRIVLAA